MRRDEWTQAVTDKAARSAFVVIMLTLGGFIIYYGSIVEADVPIPALALVVASGMLTYIATEFWLRHTQSD